MVENEVLYELDGIIELWMFFYFVSRLFANKRLTNIQTLLFRGLFFATDIYLIRFLISDK